MDKLHWFKFSYADWRMGKIQKCSEITQARFINLCCLYWSKDCILSYEDAEIEIEKEHIEELIKKKIISNIDDFINISFLDEQQETISENKNEKSISGKIGNLKRWHKDIYAKYTSKKITLEEAIELSQSIAPQSHTDSPPIAPQSQNIADKIREDKIDNIDKKGNNIPTQKEFLTEAKEKIKETSLNYYALEFSLKAKYDAWVGNGWKDGNNKKILNWKTKLANTLPYLREIKDTQTEKQNYIL